MFTRWLHDTDLVPHQWLQRALMGTAPPSCLFVRGRDTAWRIPCGRILGGSYARKQCGVSQREGCASLVAFVRQACPSPKTLVSSEVSAADGLVRATWEPIVSEEQWRDGAHGRVLISICSSPGGTSRRSRRAPGRAPCVRGSGRRSVGASTGSGWGPLRGRAGEGSEGLHGHQAEGWKSRRLQS
jgi:hypothetical protein